MKKVSLVALCAFIISSCYITDSSSKGDLTLSFESVEPIVATKAVKPGQAEYNENLLGPIYYALFPAGSTDTAPVLSGEVEFSNGSATAVIPIKSAEFNSLFGEDGNRTAIVYAVSNFPGGNGELRGKTLYQLRNMALNSDFTTTQSSFVMSAEGTASYSAASSKATGSAALSRVAAKISTVAEIAGDATDWNGWTPDPSTIGFKFCDGIKSGNLSGIPTSVDGAGDNLFDNDFRSGQRIGSTSMYGSLPFYTYPLKWTKVLGDDSDKVPYVLIRIILRKGSDARYCYYKVYFAETQFTRNTWYKLSISLRMLGSDSEDDPLVITPEDYKFYVADWKESSSDAVFNTTTFVMDLRYIEIQENEIRLYNDGFVSVQISSSHGCKIKSAKCTYPRYSGSQDSVITKEATGLPNTSCTIDEIGEKTQNSATFEISTSNQLIFNHQMVNYGESIDFDYVSYTFTIEIQHGDNPDFTETLTIVQYPSMYITAEGGDRTWTSSQSYTFKNGERQFPDNSGNTNTNMYVITITKLPSGSNYLLADSRNKKVVSIDGTSQYPAVEGGRRQLQYYHPTASSSISDEVTIAPKFRIASSFGATTSQSYSDAKFRCATYQEYGRPAGRWRLPTAAEILFMCQLTTDKCIPRLLGDSGSGTSEYWCGNGYVSVYNGNSTNPPVVHQNDKSGEYYVRCVYDEWYWENSAYPTVDINTFTWGDMNVQL